MAPKKRISSAQTARLASRLAEQESVQADKVLHDEVVALLKKKDRATLLAVKKILTGESEPEAPVRQ
eukprot:4725465-Lingulodinium_polyedra.AAC.1